MLLATADPDWFARLVAALGLAVSLAVLFRQVYRDHKDRDRVEITLQPAYRWQLDDHLEVAVVTVRRVGRPVTVEKVDLEIVDPRPSPRICGWTPYSFLEDLSLAVARSFPAEQAGVADLAALVKPGTFTIFPVVSPDLPHLLTDGATASWAYRFNGTIERSVPAYADGWLVIAVASLSNGKTCLSKPAPVRLRSWDSAAMDR